VKDDEDSDWAPSEDDGDGDYAGGGGSDESSDDGEDDFDYDREPPLEKVNEVRYLAVDIPVYRFICLNL
jgi:hypothetical protein